MIIRRATVDKPPMGTLQYRARCAYRKAAKMETGLADNDPQQPHPDRTAELLRRVTELVAEHKLAELTVEEDDLKICVRGMEPEVAPHLLASVPMHPHLLPPSQSPAYSQTPVLSPAISPMPAAPVAAPMKSTNRIAQESPMVGVYYRSPSPDDPPFVVVGDIISIGQPIGLIEAMKVYSELPSEVAGRVVEIAVQNGKLVQQGQPILYVEPV